MRAHLYPLVLILSAACRTPTSPTSDPAAAVTRDVTRQTFDVQVQNPCTGEGALLTISAVITTQASGPIVRFGVLEKITGIGDLGTVYTGQFHIASVSHRVGTTQGGADHFSEIIRGSDGSGFSTVATFVSDPTGAIKLELYRFRCL